MGRGETVQYLVLQPPAGAVQCAEWQCEFGRAITESGLQFAFRLGMPMTTRRLSLLVSLLCDVLFTAGSIAAAESGLKPGDVASTIEEDLPFGTRHAATPNLPLGTEVTVTEVRGSWIGGYVTLRGKRYGGWLEASKLKLLVPLKKQPTPSPPPQRLSPRPRESTEVVPPGSEHQSRERLLDQVADRILVRQFLEFQFKKLKGSAIQGIASKSQLTFHERVAWAIVLTEEIGLLVPGGQAIAVAEANIGQSVFYDGQVAMDSMLQSELDGLRAVSTANKEMTKELWEITFRDEISLNGTLANQTTARLVVDIARALETKQTREMAESLRKAKEQLRKAIAKRPEVLTVFAEIEGDREREATDELRKSHERVVAAIEEARKKK